MRNKFSVVGLVLVLGSIVVSACGPTGPQTATTEPAAPPATELREPTLAPVDEDILEEAVKVPGEALVSEKERTVSPDVSDAELSELVEGNSTFAFDLYRFLVKQEVYDNLLYSPYSISLALAMTYAGARGETEEQMADVLGFTLRQDQIHPAFNALDQEFARRGERTEREGQVDERRPNGFRLNIANAIWGQQDYHFQDAFLDVLAENYGAGLRILDFIGGPDASRVTINEWVSEETEGKIENLIPPGTVDPLTRLILTNAIYFNAAWEHPFPKKAIRDGAFTLLDGDQVTVPMMSQTNSFGYAIGAGYQAVELPYAGREMSMLILLPEAGDFKPFEVGLDGRRVQSVVDNLTYCQVAVTMPTLQFNSRFSLKQALAELGMPAAFSGAADFSGMTGRKDLLISDVLHKAFVSVDEEGTEAAAATAVVMKLSAMPAEPVAVTIDHPFVFLIRDAKTDGILFVGRVVDPSA